MADEQYLLPVPPKPEATQLSQHPADRRRSTIAIAVAAIALVFTGVQAYEAHEARVDAQKASEIQKLDVERSRKAAEQASPPQIEVPMLRGRALDGWALLSQRKENGFQTRKISLQ